MSEFNQMTFNEFTMWQKSSTYNNAYTYNYINNSQFYASIPLYLRPFYQRRVQQWLWWYDGFVPYFHGGESGVMATHLATSIVNKLTKKVFGSRLLLKTAGKVNGEKDSVTKMTEWADNVKLEKALRRAVTFAGAGGTALIKTNKSADGELWIEAVRIDRFVSVVDTATGKVQSVECYLLTTTASDREDDKGTYFLTEKRFYGDYKTLEGEMLNDIPLVVYSVYRASGTSVNMGINPKGKERIPFKDLPKKVRKAILNQYGALDFDCPKPLPFKDLGCDLLCWTNGVSGLPELPYGESILDSIIALLQEYDYANSAMATDMYVGRGRVLVPATMLNNNVIGGVENWNAGFDKGIYTKMPSSNGVDEKPIPLQFELRSNDWKALRDNILESIAVNIGVSTSSIGAFLNDGTARTAREVSAEENDTVAYVADTRGILEPAINDMLDRVRLYKGLDEKVVIRWTQANLSNPYMLTEMKANQIAQGLTSLEDAIADLNPDDDEETIKRKVARAKADYAERTSMPTPFDDGEEDPNLEL